MNISRFKEILKEEVSSVLKEASITKRFSKAVEALQSIQLKQQQLRKKFVSEKDAKKKEALKQSLITLHKQVQRAESDFNQAVTSEPIDLEEKKNKGLWANIHAKRKRGEKPAHKNSKAHKDAVKAAKSINKEGKLNEDAFKSFLSDDPAFKLYTATNTENRKSVKARKLNKGEKL